MEWIAVVGTGVSWSLAQTLQHIHMCLGHFPNLFLLGWMKFENPTLL